MRGMTIEHGFWDGLGYLRAGLGLNVLLYRDRLSNIHRPLALVVKYS